MFDEGNAENPLSSLLSEAARVKDAQNSTLRKVFDSYPEYLQNTLIADEEALELRQEGWAQRCDKARQWKEEGNRYFRDEQWMEAYNTYTRAVGLFVFLEGDNDLLRQHGIRDEDIVLRETVPLTPLEEVNRAGLPAADVRPPTSPNMPEEARRLLLALYLNLSAAATSMDRLDVGLQAANDALRVDPRSAKALFRRARARLGPGSGTTEHEDALRDLRAAHELEPGDATIRKAFHRLRAKLRSQQTADRRTFGGLFRRGRIVTEDDEAEAASRPGEAQANRERVLQQLVGLHQQLVREGKVEQAEELKKHILRVRGGPGGGGGGSGGTGGEGDESPTPRAAVDFRNPSPEMREEALRFG